MTSEDRLPERIMSSPESSPIGEDHAQQQVNEKDANFTESAQKFPLNMHPILSNKKLEEKKDEIWSFYSEAYKNRNKKCAEYDTLDKNYKKELQKYENDLASLKIQGEEYQKKRAAFIRFRDEAVTAFNCGMHEGKFQFGELADGMDFVPDYNLYNLGDIQAQSRDLSVMYRAHEKNVIDTAMLKKNVDEIKTEVDAALKELIEAQDVYKRAYKMLRKITEQCYLNVFDGFVGDQNSMIQVKRRRTEKHTHQERDDDKSLLKLHPIPDQSDAPSSSTTSPAKNEAPGNLTPKKENGRRRK